MVASRGTRGCGDGDGDGDADRAVDAGGLLALGLGQRPPVPVARPSPSSSPSSSLSSSPRRSPSPSRLAGRCHHNPRNAICAPFAASCSRIPVPVVTTISALPSPSKSAIPGKPSANACFQISVPSRWYAASCAAVRRRGRLDKTRAERRPRARGHRLALRPHIPVSPRAVSRDRHCRPGQSRCGSLSSQRKILYSEGAGAGWSGRGP